ncbi:MAG TPA: NAD(P)H-quinone oxidoreductase [Gemmatirosa sp.]
MRAVVITRPGGPEVLAVEERPTPAPGAGEILVRVHATALNRADLMQRRGQYPPPPGAPADVPGLEYAGEVVALGPGARERAVGDRVFGLVGGGAYADYVVAHERTAVLVPNGLAWTDAAAVPEAFMTAHDGLIQADARPGDVILVHAAASGVGLAALQLARAFGMTALGSARTASKLDAIRAHGAADALAIPADVARDEGALRAALVDFVRARTGGRGADVALDLVGGPYVNATLHALAPRGRHVLIGLVAGREGSVDVGRVLSARLTLRGTVMRARPLEERIATAQRFAHEVVPLLARGVARPTVDRVFALADVAAAHHHLESDATTGKVVLRVS